MSIVLEAGLNPLNVELVPISVRLRGDLDDDGKVTRHDGFLYSLWYEGAAISSISPLTDEEFLWRADFNGDGAVNVLDMVLFGQVTEFDPWAWDKNKNCYIDIDENLDAVDAYIAGWITQAQLNEIIYLYENHIRNPAC